MVELELSTHGRDKAFFACMSKSSNGAGLKNMVYKEFAEEHRAKLRVFNREEVCLHFGVKDSENNITLVHNLIDRLPSNCVLFLDEFPIKNTKKQPEDWSALRNTREGDVSVIISFQPFDYKPTLKSKILNVKFPENANVVKLSVQYRSSQSIFNFNNKLKTMVPVQQCDLAAKPCDSILGPKVSIVNIDKSTEWNAVKIWIHYKLWQLYCTENQIKILTTNGTEAVAGIILENFKSSITNIGRFQGCEAPVIVVLCGKERDYNFAEIVNMCSRAQYKVEFKY